MKLRKIKSKCSICGKVIKININKKGKYCNGYYFGVMGMPIKGTGEYKKVGTAKFLNKKIKVVKWTGKERDIEYWECNKCYEEAMHEYWLEEIIERLYGKRCKDYEAGCGCCQAWNIFDTLIEEYRTGSKL